MGEVHQERIFIECPKNCGFQVLDEEQMRSHLLERCANILREEEAGERDPEVDYEDAIEKCDEQMYDQEEQKRANQLLNQQIREQFMLGGDFGEDYGNFEAPSSG